MLYTLQINKWMLAHDLGPPFRRGVEALLRLFIVIVYGILTKPFKWGLIWWLTLKSCKHQREEIDLSFGNLEESSKLISMADYKPVSTRQNGTNRVVVTGLPSLGCVFWRVLLEKHWIFFFFSQNLFWMSNRDILDICGQSLAIRSLKTN